MTEQRAIKYRVWDVGAKQLAPVAEISFGDGGSALTITCVRAPKGKHYPSLVHGESGFLMQFTGMRDVYGTDIYEGDIVVKAGYPWFDDGVPGYRDTVEWVYSQWQVVHHCVNPAKGGISDGINTGLNDAGDDEHSRTDWKVIGNIYETPELLERRSVKQ